MTEHCRTASEFWARLVVEADIQSAGRDADLVDEIRTRLRLGPGPIEQVLAGTSVEDLIAALFGATSAFARMWEDLLALFEKASATDGAGSLEVAYNFGDGLELTFDLAHFRKTLEQLRHEQAPFALDQVDQQAFWDVKFALDRDSPVRPQKRGDPSLEAFFDGCLKGTYSEQLPGRKKVTDSASEALLAETCQLATIVLDDLREAYGTYAQLRERSSNRTPTSGMPPMTLALIGSDHWVPFVVHAVHQATERDDVDYAALDQALTGLRNADVSIRSQQTFLVDLLCLPIWKHRYDLYSNWVATVALGVFAAEQVVVHASDGVLRFLFSGTHLATIDAVSPRVHMWTEMRRPLQDPLGAGRKNNVQPDITLRADPLTAQVHPLVIECKQYHTPDNKAFGDTLTDYARAHPEAVVVLAQYGGGKELTVLKYVAPAVRDRVRFIPRMHPYQVEALADFRAIVRRAVGLEPIIDLKPDLAEVAAIRPAVSNATTTQNRANIVLTWGALPLDLDLHLLCRADDVHVHYEDKGRLDRHPYAQLLNDDQRGNGHEVLHVGRLLDATYEVEVVNYSCDGDFSGAVLTLDCDAVIHTFMPPQDLNGHVWRVCVLDGTTGEVTVPSPELRV